MLLAFGIILNLLTIGSGVSNQADLSPSAPEKNKPSANSARSKLLLETTKSALGKPAHTHVSNGLTKKLSTTNQITEVISTAEHPPITASTVEKIRKQICKTQIKNQELKSNQTCYTPENALKCFHDPLFCDKHFQSGKRELQSTRPVYGEYSSLDHDKWFYVIQHGGIAFLFHPCADKTEKEALRNLAADCLHRHIIAPYSMLPEKYPVALVSWGCFYLAPVVNITEMKDWLRVHALKGPASHVSTNGGYQENLVKESQVLTDVKDSYICPSENELKKFVTTPKPKKVHLKHNGEQIILDRLDKAMHKRDKGDVKIAANITVTEVKTGSAIWAASSLVFICGILVGWLLYTKYWSPSDNEYQYSKLHSMTDDFDYKPGHTDFSMLKSSQRFVSIFKNEKKSNRRLDSMSNVNLMIPIDEEEDEL